VAGFTTSVARPTHKRSHGSFRDFTRVVRCATTSVGWCQAAARSSSTTAPRSVGADTTGRVSAAVTAVDGTDELRRRMRRRLAQSAMVTPTGTNIGHRPSSKMPIPARYSDMREPFRMVDGVLRRSDSAGPIWLRCIRTYRARRRRAGSRRSRCTYPAHRCCRGRGPAGGG